MATVIKGRVRALSPHFGLYEDLSMVVCQFVTGIAALFEKKTGLTFIAPPDFAGEPYPLLAPSCDLYITKTSPKFLWNSFAVRTGLEPVTPCVTGMYSNQLN